MASPTGRRVVLGTAGHIDHGKTSLVKALTGTDTDRLREEKERGITIELGFAHLRLPGGIDLAVVDVPGHERFVKNMVAGASGIDLVLLVVAADEGVMPQTREHLDICSLLRVKSGLVALTKADLVEPDLLELAREDVAELIEGTFLEGAPVVAVSAASGQGLPELVARLDELAQEVPQKGAQGIFRLPVDRVFSMKGFGTVVTGTMVSGSVRREEDVEILPSGHPAKVRGIQVHGEAVDKALAGQRTALNLAGVSVEELNRGDSVVHPASLEPTYMVDAKLQLLPSAGRPIQGRLRCRLHVGTQEAPVLVALLDRDECRPGEESYVQLRSSSRLVCCPGDRFVLRALSPARTIGGGVILDHRPRRHKGRKEEVWKDLETLEGGGPGDRIEVFLRKRGPAGLAPGEAQVALGVSLEEARNLLQAVVRQGKGFVSDRRTQRHIHGEVVSALETQALEILARFHAENPLRKGLGVEELRSKYPEYIEPRLVEFILIRLGESGRVVSEGDVVRRGDFQLQLSADDEALRGRMLEFVRSRRYEAPTVEELASAVGQNAKALAPVVEYLVGQGMLTRTKEGFYFESALVEEFVEAVIGLFREKAEIGVAEVKELTGTTRKYTIPLLEYLDGRKVTVRRGDARVAGPRGRA